MQRRYLVLMIIALALVMVGFVRQVIDLWPILVTMRPSLTSAILVHAGALLCVIGMCLKIRSKRGVSLGDMFFIAGLMVATWASDLRLLEKFVR